MGVDMEDVLKAVKLSPAERMVLASEARKLHMTFGALSDAFDALGEDFDVMEVHKLWSQVEIPMQYVTNVLGIRYHEAAHKAGGDTPWE